MAATIITLKYRTMTTAELERAYSRESILGNGAACDEIIDELDRRAA